MKILIDMVHLGDINFYRRVIAQLRKKNTITLTVLRRGNLPEIVKKEFPDIEQVLIGKHRKTKWGKILGLVEREFLFCLMYARKKFDRVTSFGFYPAIAAKLFGVRSVLFHDDYEYRSIFNLCKKYGDVFVVPDSIPVRGKNVVKYPGFKDLSLLYDFKPQRAALKRYKVEENKYVFVRDIDAISLNYADSQRIDFTSIFHKLRKQGYKVLYYPENKDMKNRYQGLCKVLHAPVKDLHSLLYYARFTISSGDGIARESSLLGTPSIYAGGRKMHILKQLIKLGVIVEATTAKNIRKAMDSFLKKRKSTTRNIMKKKTREWGDPTQVVVREILK